jgi:hypothetical protein
LNGQPSGDDIIENKKNEPEDNENSLTDELAKLMFGLYQTLTREIEIKSQLHEERRMDSEQNAYMEGMFMCDFIYSNL